MCKAMLSAQEIILHMEYANAKGLSAGILDVSHPIQFYIPRGSNVFQPHGKDKVGSNFCFIICTDFEECTLVHFILGCINEADTVPPERLDTKL